MFKFLRKTALWILLLPFATFGLGAASNQLVLIANHDKFPVMVNQAKIDHYNSEIAAAVAAGEPAPDPIDPNGGMIDDTHCVMTNKTHLNFLADVFDFHSAIYSVGDGLLYFGDWLMGFSPFLWGFAVIQKLRQV